MFPYKLTGPRVVVLAAVVLGFGPGWLALQAPAGSQPPGATAGGTGLADQPDTKPTTRRAWDAARDFPAPVASDKAVTFDYPVVYVRVPRPYPKAYNGINHL